MTSTANHSLLRVLSWNLRFQGFGKRIDGITQTIDSENADVLTFQEVSAKHSQDFFTRLEKMGYRYLHYAWRGTQFESGSRMRHGVLIAARL